MISGKNVSPWIIGLALFSMFFGSGNLIFPITVGKYSQQMYLIGSLGFLMTAVLLPFTGVVTMVSFKGDYKKFFSLLGPKAGFLFMFCLLTFWIPLGSGPRCITLAYAAIKTYIPTLSLTSFSLFYSLLIFLMTYRESRVIALLGKVLTPVLLLSLLSIILAGIYSSPKIVSIDSGALTVFSHALVEGYNTQDLIASFFFSSALFHILQPAKLENSHLKLVLQASVIGIAILAAVYIGLLYLGAAYAEILEQTPKDRLLSQLSLHLLGTKMAFIPIITIALACLTTSVALSLVFTTFLKESVCQERISYTLALAITVGSTFFMSLLGFEGVSHILGSAMQILYPSMILLMIVNLCIRCCYGKKCRSKGALRG